MHHTSTSDQPAMFITVKFGDNEEQLFNPDCSNEVLLHNIRSRCNCRVDDVVELSNEEGEIKNLHKNLKDHGSRYLKNRESFILLRVEGNGEDDTFRNFVPLLRGRENDKEFIEKINPMPMPRKHSEDAKSGRNSRRGSMMSRRGSLATTKRNSKSNGSTPTRK